ncbi:ATP-dependent helicase [Mycoplasmopsis sturni]|uniref:ATP-dependent helicase n=1 Tax=Mycoplasmopsis sturni TaxID=39047 RepID=UPI0005628319|nr:UvrD-helicase domain-containing protein [Mycoplasmopsis sturni]
MLLKKIDVLSDLNDSQREAVEYFDTPLRIIAGAGSGKTKVLTRKVTYLINDLGISPNNILAVTFTNKAANEMHERISKYIENTKDLKIFTFHSLCTWILRKYINLLGYPNNFLIIDEVDKQQILADIYKKVGLSQEQVTYKNMIQYISYAKNNFLDVYELANNLKLNYDDPVVQTYQEYLNELARKGVLDFDDLILECHRLLSEHPNVAAYYKKQFSYILIDEFQDTSEIQYDIIKKIVGDDTHLTIVGDPDQTIYTWRGANVNLILDFEKEHQDVKTIVLDINYRSTGKILDAANKLIQHNKKRFSKNLITKNEEGVDVEFYHGYSVEAEARWVVQKINELKKQKNQLKSIAILYRSNFYSRPFEEALIQENINHKIFNGMKFFQRTEIKDALAFLRVLFDGSDIAFKRIINVPNRAIGPKTLQEMENFAAKKGTTLLNALVKYSKELPFNPQFLRKRLFPFLGALRDYKRLLNDGNPIHKVLNHLLNKLNYFEHISNNKNLRGSAQDNVNELILSIKNWEKNNPSKGLGDYLNMVSLLSSTDETDNSDNHVSLMTVHSAKGLEFDNVFIVGLTEGIFPSIRVINNSEEAISYLNREDDPIEEERRLAYVSVTRARKKLFLSESRGTLLGTNKPKVPSRFLYEIGIKVDDQILMKDFSIPSTVNHNRTKANNKIIVGDIISHITFGEGEVLAVNSQEIVVRFIKDKKEKTLNKDHPSIKVISN